MRLAPVAIRWWRDRDRLNDVADRQGRTTHGAAEAVHACLGYANLLASWTMFPLLKKDELRVPYMVLSSLWAYLMGMPPFSITVYTKSTEEGEWG